MLPPLPSASCVGAMMLFSRSMEPVAESVVVGALIVSATVSVPVSSSVSVPLATVKAPRLAMLLAVPESDTLLEKLPEPVVSVLAVTLPVDSVRLVPVSVILPAVVTAPAISSARESLSARSPVSRKPPSVVMVLVPVSVALPLRSLVSVPVVMLPGSVMAPELAPELLRASSVGASTKPVILIGPMMVERLTLGTVSVSTWCQ